MTIMARLTFCRYVVIFSWIAIPITSSLNAMFTIILSYWNVGPRIILHDAKRFLIRLYQGRCHGVHKGHICFPISDQKYKTFGCTVTQLWSDQQ